MIKFTVFNADHNEMKSFSSLEEGMEYYKEVYQQGWYYLLDTGEIFEEIPF